jgi:hypothetical protein
VRRPLPRRTHDRVRPDDLAVKSNVAAASQHQAMHDLVCLDTRVLNHALPGRIHAGRADQPIHVPMVMTHAAVAAIISLLDGTAQLVAILLDGRGVCLVAAGWLRVKDIDVQRKPLTVCAGPGDQDLFTTFPSPGCLCSRITWPGSRPSFSTIRLRGMARSTGGGHLIGALRTTSHTSQLPLHFAPKE